MISSTIIAIVSCLIWLFIVELLNLCLLPLWAQVFLTKAEKILGISRVLSFFTFTWIVWMLSEFAGVPFSPAILLTVLIGLVLCGHMFLRLNYPSWRYFFFDFKASNYYCYLITVGILLVFRFFNSEISWGEKPLEFSLFNYFVIETKLPAEHPWAAGSNMSYYYLGFFGLSLLQKLSTLDPAIAFNLSIAFIAACLVSTYESVFKVLNIKPSRACLFAFLLVFGSSLNPAYLAISGEAKFNFDFFWATSRNFTSPAFAEYPIWGLLFADLHAHIISMPLVVAIIGICWLSIKEKLNISALIICGFFWGLLYSINGWDFVSTAIALALIVASYLRFSFELSWLKSLFGSAVSLGFGALISFIPFRLSQQQIYSSGWGWIESSEFNSLFHICLHFGLQLGLILLTATGLILTRQNTKLRICPLLIVFALAPFLPAIASATYSNASQNWYVVTLSTGLALLGSFIIFSNTKDKNLRYSGSLLIAAACILSMTENMYLIDRMNTIFKGYQIIWPLLGIAACINLSVLADRFNVPIKGLGRYLSYGLYVACFIPISISLFGSAINIKSKLSNQHSSNEPYTLNGTNYLEKDNVDEAVLIRWLQRNVKDKAYIIEASGPGYQEYSRVVMHTGLPTLIGWEHHTKQGGVPQADVEQRSKDLKEIFNTTDKSRADALLRYYGIDFIFVGKLEQQNYSKAGLNKFSANPDLFKAVKIAGDYAIYLTHFSPLKYEKFQH
jgi:YYY domain-containing protein